MKKGAIIFSVISLMLINFVSASYYGGFSLGNLLDQIDPSTVFLLATFFIAFAAINYSLIKVFKGNRSTASIIAFAMAVLITYSLNRSGWRIESMFYNFGISTEMMYFIVLAVLIGGGLYITFGFKKGFAKMLMVFGGALMILTIFTNWILERGITLIIGTIIFVIGMSLLRQRPNTSSST